MSDTAEAAQTSEAANSTDAADCTNATNRPNTADTADTSHPAADHHLIRSANHIHLTLVNSLLLSHRSRS